MKNSLFALIIILLLASPVIALDIDGEVSFGKYLRNDFDAAPGPAIEQAQYMSNIRLWYDFDFKSITLRQYIGVETLSNESGDAFVFSPVSVRYTSGARINWWALFVDYKHQCWHGVDIGTPAETLDLIKFGIRF